MSVAPPVPALIALALLLVAAALTGRRDDPVDRVRARLLLGVAVLLAVLLGSWSLQEARPDLLGLPVVLGPGLAAASGLLVVGAPPWRRTRSAAPRSAVLQPRSGLRIAGRADLLVPGALAAVVTGLVLVLGATASPDEQGRSRVLTVVAGDVTSGASPYPGWYYGLPLLGATAALLGAAALAVRRLVLLPAREGIDLRRRQAVRAVSAVTSSALLLHVAGLLAAAGGALRSSVVSDPATASPVPAGAGEALWVVAVLAGLAAVALLATAVVRAASLAAAPTAHGAAAP